MIGDTLNNVLGGFLPIIFPVSSESRQIRPFLGRGITQPFTFHTAIYANYRDTIPLSFCLCLMEILQFPTSLSE